MLVLQNIAEKIIEKFSKTALKRRQARNTLLPYGIFPTAFSIITGTGPCNHFCLFCPQSLHKPQKTEWIDIAIVEKAIKEIPKTVKSISITSYTESSLCPIMSDIIKIIKRTHPEIIIDISVNGSLITKEKVSEYIDAGLDVLQYSFDAADKKTFNKLIGKDCFDKVCENLKMAYQTKQEKKSKMLIVTHIMEFENQKKIFPDFQKKWKEYTDNISLRRVISCNNAIAKQLEENGFIRPPESVAERYPCASPFFHIVLSSNGHYYPCCIINNEISHSEEERLKYSLGNSRDITFKDAFERLGKLRKLHVAGQWDMHDKCAECDAWKNYDKNIWIKKQGKFSCGEQADTSDLWK